MWMLGNRCQQWCEVGVNSYITINNTNRVRDILYHGQCVKASLTIANVQKYGKPKKYEH